MFVYMASNNTLQANMPCKVLLLHGIFHKCPEQWVRMIGAALELGMELYADEETQSGYLDGFNNAAVGRGAGNAKTGADKPLAQCVVELIAVTVTFMDERFTVSFRHL